MINKTPFSNRRITHLVAIFVFFLLAFSVMPQGAVATKDNSGRSAALKTVSRDANLAVFVSDLLHGKGKSQKHLFIDVRPANQFDAARLPGSINLPLHAIRTKSFLKKQPLVLVNNGCQYSLLEAEAKRLGSLGFNVRVLVGGLNCWKNSGGIIEGDPFASRVWDKMQSYIFVQEEKYADWTVVDFRESSLIDDDEFMGKAISASMSADVEQTASDLHKAIKKQAKGRFQFILVINEDGEHHERLKVIMEKTGFANVFFLDGGLRAYRQHARDLVLMNQPSDKRVKTTNKCPSCGDLNM